MHHQPLLLANARGVVLFLDSCKTHNCGHHQWGQGAKGTVEVDGARVCFFFLSLQT